MRSTDLGADYTDRAQAGDRLAEALRGFAGRDDVVVLGLVRGGVPVAARVAAALRAPLDIMVVRKLGVPWAPEVAFGALGPGGVVVAVPVGAAEAVALLRNEADEVICPMIPAGFGAVSRYYREFPQTTDDEVRTLLARG